MPHPLSDEALDQLFRKARTHNKWLDRPVSDELLHWLYDLMKWGPTSANLSPARIVFLRTRQAKERLRPALIPANVNQTMTAPVTAIVAYDERFYEKAPRLFPHYPGMRDLFINSPELAEATAVELPVQPRVRRSHGSASARPAAGVRRGMLAALKGSYETRLAAAAPLPV